MKKYLMPQLLLLLTLATPIYCSERLCDAGFRSASGADNTKKTTTSWRTIIDWFFDPFGLRTGMNKGCYVPSGRLSKQEKYQKAIDAEFYDLVKKRRDFEKCLIEKATEERGKLEIPSSCEEVARLFALAAGKHETEEIIRTFRLAYGRK